MPGSLNRKTGETRHDGDESVQTVSVNISEGGPDSPQRFQLKMSECVETKTITTTTRTTRKYPFFVGNVPPHETRDEKEYPLWTKATPPELASFSYRVTTKDMDDRRGDMIRRVPTRDTPAPAGDSADDEQMVDSTTPDRTDRERSFSPLEPYSLRARQTRSQTSNAPSPSLVPRQARPIKTERSPIQGNSQTSRGASSGVGSQRRLDRHPGLIPTGLPATPDTSDVMESGEGSLPGRPASLQLSQARNPSGLSSLDADASLDGSDAQTIFSSIVATPPVTDADLEPFPNLRSSRRPTRSRPSVDVVAAQDASLPSPRLSPTLAAAQLQSEEQSTIEAQPEELDSEQTFDDSLTEDGDKSAVDLPEQGVVSRRRKGDGNVPVIDPQMMLEAFDSMQEPMKKLMMFQLLRRCPRTTLRTIANVVNPALKCDFFSQLPLELSYHVMSFLNHRDLCRATQVSKHWRSIIDRNETGWKELLARDGYNLPPGELEKAIAQGWGWQDPVGWGGFERDLSMHRRLISSEQDLLRTPKEQIALRSRSSKRKRGLSSYSGSDRSKRRAGSSDLSSREDKIQEVGQHKSAGPLSAAGNAILAVPDPRLGIPSLRQLHLYKSLYRRHNMMRQSWTNGEVKPAHLAFAAHPRHVVTCLQFDDDKIITGSDDTFIHVYDTKTGKLRNKLVGHEGGVWALQYHGNILVSGSTDRSVRVWDIERGICQQVFHGHTSTVRCLQILTPVETGRDALGKPIMQPEKPLIITGSRDSFLRVWRLPESKSKRYFQAGPPAQESDCPYFIRALQGHTHSVRAISAHGDTLVSGSYDSNVRVWRISTGECLHVLQGHTQKVYSVVLDHERGRCISGSMDSLVKIWDLATGACLHTLDGHNLLVGLLDLRDERLVSAAADSTLRIWDPETGRCKNTLMAHTGAITCFQHDGQKVISGSEKTVKMWDIQTGECIQDLLTDLSGVWQVKFDGRRCVAAVQRDQLTYVEILDFGAVRDGQPPEELGRRILLDDEEVQAAIEEEV